MAFTDNPDLFVSFHEDGFNRRLFHVMHRVHPCLRRCVSHQYGIPHRGAKNGKAPDEAGRVLHRSFRADAPAQGKI
jgi:hypothetical protein